MPPELPGLEAQIQRLMYLYRQHDQAAYGQFILGLITEYQDVVEDLALKNSIASMMAHYWDLDQPSLYDEL